MLNQRNGLCILYLENYQDMRQRLKARQLQEETTSREIGCSIKEMDFASSIWKITKISRQLQDETVSRQIGCSIKEMDFASSIWKITKICDSVSKRGQLQEETVSRQIGCSIKKWTLHPLSGKLPRYVTASQSETTPR
ncbi:hypothetical protein CDAR_247971 [Caerostris darwini]|uniref:Uncharacterized protein n=1 Tax=Caerostris darwini TaxID=1538125 RepID=A0AAV4VIX4_9ARAC|nr:hypothetical protein CDAR_247971 [Caerostris darwini]